MAGLCADFSETAGVTRFRRGNDNGKMAPPPRTRSIKPLPPSFSLPSGEATGTSRVMHGCIRLVSLASCQLSSSRVRAALEQLERMLSSACLRLSEICGLRTRPSEDADPQDFLRTGLTRILFHGACILLITANGLWTACLISVLFSKMHYQQPFIAVISLIKLQSA